MTFIETIYNYFPLLFVADAGTLMVWGILGCMLFFAFRFFRSALQSANHRALSLQNEMDAMRQQMDHMAKMETEAKENAEREGAAKSKLLSAISHEVRTPMNGILGMTALLKETSLNPEQREYAETIISSGRVLMDKVNEILVQDLLESSKSDAVTTDPVYKTVDLIPCIEETLDLFAKKAAQTGTALLYQVKPGTPLRFTSDEKRIRKILVNLVDNAVEVSRGGNILVIAGSGDNQLHIDVIDSGPGILPSLLPEIFTRTLPADYSTRYREKNKGLGLLVCKKITGQLGGSIRASNNPDGGCTFSVVLPVSLTETVENNGSGYTMKGFEGEQVLVISANERASTIYAEWLEQWGLVAVCAINIQQAGELLTQTKCKVAVIDQVGDNDRTTFGNTGNLSRQFPQLRQIILFPVDDYRYTEPDGGSPVIRLQKPLKQYAFFDAVLTQFRHGDEPEASAAPRSNKLSEGFVNNFPLRILIAEDNEVNQKWTSKILKKLGYSATIAENGKVVLDKVSLEAYDLILMDVQMPEMDGLEATRMIRVCLEKQPVIIAMTANVMHGDRQACIQAGMDDYISKPVELPALVNMLEKWGTQINEKK